VDKSITPTVSAANQCCSVTTMLKDLQRGQEVFSAVLGFESHPGPSLGVASPGGCLYHEVTNFFNYDYDSAEEMQMGFFILAFF